MNIEMLMGRDLDTFFSQHISVLADIIHNHPEPPPFKQASIDAAARLLFIVAIAERAREADVDITDPIELVADIRRHHEATVEFRDSILAAIKKYTGQDTKSDDWPDLVNES